MMMLVVASLGVALVSFIIYALERRSKSEPIVWEHEIKLFLFSGLMTSGVVYATENPLPDVTKIVENIPAVQDMFVGTPSF